MATGMPARSAPAINEPQKNTSPRISSVTTPMLMTFSLDDETNVSEYTKSCMLNVKAKIATVSMPAALSGRITRTTAPNLEQPSIIAASSISNGIVLKKPAINQVQNGIVKVGYARISD